MITGDVLDGIGALIVDWDGTVVDTHHANYTALNDALRPYSVQLERHWYREHVGLSITDLLAEVVAIHGDLPTTAIVTSSRQRLMQQLHQIQPIPATIELLDHAHDRGLPCAVASGAARSLVNGAIRVLGLGHLFTAVVTREDVRRGKPAPELYLRAATMLGVPPQRCLAVDDALDGITSADRAGMPVLTLHGHRLCWATTTARSARDAESEEKS